MPRIMKTSITLNFLLLLVLNIGILLQHSCAQNKKGNASQKGSLEHPNIIYILADDMGYGDISSLNSESGIQTPHMDRIVKEGIHFTDAHSNSAVCTPTRYGILTGRYAWRSRLKKGVLWGYDPPLIESERTTVASFLHENGYKTACVGKWHLGLGWQAKDPTKPIATEYAWNKVFKKGDDSNVDFSKPATGPNQLGFDYSYIIPASLDMTPYVYLENGKATKLPTQYTAGRDPAVSGRGVFWRAGEVAPDFDFHQVLDHLTEKAVGYIEEQGKDIPFFLYFPLTAPHTPWLPTEEVKGKSRTGTYGDFVTQVDNTVGAILKVLDEKKMVDNTLIIVTSDNGSHWNELDKAQYAHRANFIYRGQKADIFEGGHRIPFMARWPDRIAKNSSSNQTISTTDLLATIAGVLEKNLPEKVGEDSFDMLPALFGINKDPIRGYTIHHSLEGYFSIRRGKWKLTTALGSGGFTDPVRIETYENGQAGTLFDIESDPHEEKDLYTKHPEIVAELQTLLEKVQKGM